MDIAARVRTLGRADRAPSPAVAGPPEVDPALLATRERLVERFAVMQADLGGLFYEMAIRNAVALDVLTGKAAELQRIDEELEQVERRITAEREGVSGSCPSCGTPYARDAAFCSSCGHPLSTSAHNGLTA
jgi:hypothetical protein